MHVTFLSAHCAITKVFASATESSYPRVHDFTSHSEQVSDLDSFYTALKHHAKQGHCLLKGNVNRELRDESRAGSTDPHAPTQWLCLDLDGIPGLTKADDFLKTIPELKDVDYVIQYSASMGINPAKGFSAHIFMLLDTPTLPSVLKAWLTQLNLDSTLLEPHIALTRTQTTLKWPLDVSVCQNDKLIYIAPPVVQGSAKDGFKGQRIKLVKKKKRAVSLGGITPNAESLRARTTAKVNALRKAQDLPAKTFATKIASGVEVLAKPGHANVTGIKEERDFVYLNLNGGDSWGYFHPTGNPEILYNFKGEPNYLTRELLPDYYARYREAMRSAQLAEPEGGDAAKRRYLAFLDPREDAYYRGYYEEATEELVLHKTGQKAKVVDFLKQHGQYVDEFIPEWHYEFRFDDERQIDFNERFINKYQPSPYMKRTYTVPCAVPPTVAKILHHVLGNDEQCVEHFLNWLAVVYQHRCRAQTMWVLTGTQGTGKGVLFHRIIAPLFNPEHCTTKSLADLDAQFTGFLENNVFLLVDEASVNAVKNIDKVVANVKNWCVEPYVSIRRMRADHYMAANYINIIFASNNRDPILIDANDRRFNVATFQPKRLVLTDTEINETLPSELAAFAQYLATRKADPAVARTPLDNAARRDMMQLSVSSLQEVADALLAGNFGFFVDQLPSRSGIDATDQFAMLSLDNYEKVLAEAFENLDKPMKLTREQLRDLFDYVVGGMPTSPNKLTSRLKHQGIRIKRIRKNEQSAQGIEVRFTADADAKKAWANYVKSKQGTHLHLHRASG